MYKSSLAGNALAPVYKSSLAGNARCWLSLGPVVLVCAHRLRWTCVVGSVGRGSQVGLAGWACDGLCVTVGWCA